MQQQVNPYQIVLENKSDEEGLATIFGDQSSLEYELSSDNFTNIESYKTLTGWDRELYPILYLKRVADFFYFYPSAADRLANTNALAQIDVSGPVPTPPIGAEVFLWYGSGSVNWNEIQTYGKHSLIKNADNLELQRFDGTGGISTIEVQTSELYSGSLGRKLYIKYEVVSKVGNILEMYSFLQEYAGGAGAGSAEITINAFAVDGEHSIVSAGVTDGSSVGAKSAYLRIRSDSSTYSIKIYELYYL